MDKINPEITQKFLEEIKNQPSVIIDVEGLKIKTAPNVFPPRSNFSESSEKLHELFGSLNGLRVLDVGTGTGVQAIQAAKSGAKEVVALDINPDAVACAKENIKLNNVADNIKIIESDLFSGLNNSEQFNFIIANLPVTDFPLEGKAEAALYDPEYKVHKKFLSEAKTYLSDDGAIVLTHINFKGKGDFEEFEDMIKEFGYSVEKYIEIDNSGYSWRLYRIKLSS